MKALLRSLPLVLLCSTASAQPAEVWKYHQQLGGGELLLTFCLVGDHVCIERKAIAYGQVCDSQLAETMGERKSGDIRGTIPPLYHYAGFRCGEGKPWHPKTDRVFGGGNWMN